MNYKGTFRGAWYILSSFRFLYPLAGRFDPGKKISKPHKDSEMGSQKKSLPPMCKMVKSRLSRLIHQDKQAQERSDEKDFVVMVRKIGKLLI